MFNLSRFILHRSMGRRGNVLLCLPLIIGLLLVGVWGYAISNVSRTVDLEQQAIIEANADFVQMGMPFISNQGQFDDQVQFYASTFGGSVYVTNNGLIIYVLNHTESGEETAQLVLQERPQGWESLTPHGEEAAAVKISDFRGNDPTRWRSQLPAYQTINLGNMAPGIALKLRAYANRVEKLFFIQPGADPSEIRLELSGADALRVSNSGQLEVETALGLLAFSKPVAYQEIDGQRHEVEVAYRVEDAAYGFAVGDYDPSAALVIDPWLASTLLGGGNSDSAESMVINDEGHIYVAGVTESSNFPATTGSIDPDHNGSMDILLAKFDADLTTLLAATYLGGSKVDRNPVITLDPNGNIYVAGRTFSSNFPTTVGSYDLTFNGASSDAFITRLSSDLDTLLASTYLGGAQSGNITDGDRISSLAIDDSGHLYVAGKTSSADFPTTLDAYDRTYGGGFYDAFVARFDPNLTTLEASTLLGGGCTDEAVLQLAQTGPVYVAGSTCSNDFPIIGGTLSTAYQTSHQGNWDGYVARLDADLTMLTASTYLGGSSTDELYDLILVGTDQLYVTGRTASFNFPTTSNAFDRQHNGDYDVFVTGLTADLTTLSASTLLGGGGEEWGTALTVDADDYIYLTGFTNSGNFPATNGVYEPVHQGNSDAFVSKFNDSLATLTASTFLGGSKADYGNAIYWRNGYLYTAGTSGSPNFPTTAGAYKEIHQGINDVFVTKLDDRLLDDPTTPTLSLQPMTEATVGQVISVAVELSDLDTTDDLTGLQFSLTVADSSLLQPTGTPILGNFFPMDSLTSSVTTVNSWDFLLTLPSEASPPNGSGIVVYLPFEINAAGCTTLTLNNHLLSDSNAQLILHLTKDLEVCTEGSNNLQGQIYLEHRGQDQYSGVHLVLTGATNTYSSATNSVGKFVFNNIAPGPYSLSASRDFFLQATRDMEAVAATSVDLSPIGLWVGDIDQDHDIDFYDRALLSAAIFPVNDPDFDLNGDGITNVQDLILLESNIDQADSNINPPLTLSQLNASFVSAALPPDAVELELIIEDENSLRLRLISLDQPLLAVGARLSLPADVDITQIEPTAVTADGFLRWHQNGQKLYLVIAPPEGQQITQLGDLAIFSGVIPTTAETAVEAHTGVNQLISNQIYLPLVLR